MKQAKIQTMAGEKITQIALGKLYPFKGNRTVGGVDAGAIAQLAKSIQELGVQVPAVVRQVYDAGRRFRRGREIDPYPVVKLRCGCRKNMRLGIKVFKCERHGGPC